MGAALVCRLSDQPRIHAVRSWHGGGSYHPVSLSAGLAATLERRIRKHLRPCRVGETYIKVKRVWTFLYRAVDSLGQCDWLPALAAAKRYFRKALAQPHAVNPRTTTVDKNPAYPRAVKDLKRAGRLWTFSRLRRRKYLNNIVEQDHQRIKRLDAPRRPCSTRARCCSAWHTGGSRSTARRT